MNELIVFLLGVFTGIIIVLIFVIKPFIKINSENSILKTMNENLTNENTKITELKTEFISEFEQIAGKILKENTREFSKTNQEEIYNILKPFRERLIEFENKIELTKIKDTEEKTSLEAHIKIFMENSKQISQEANNLTNALKGNNQVVGAWGELMLQKILELSGLEEGVNFRKQSSFRNNENGLQRPDVIIDLTEDRHIIIDSKVSLASYEKYVNNEDNKENNLKAFLNSTKEHIKSLKSKSYEDLQDLKNPDFVLMFIPIEGAFSLLMREDNNLIDFAWKQKILFVGSSTLLATLKTIELFWKQEKQTKNVIEIAEESGKLYDKFVGLLQDLDSMGNCIEKTAEQYKNTRKKLDGKGNLINQVQKLKILGAKTSKIIDKKFFEDE